MKKYFWMAVSGIFFLIAGICYYWFVFRAENTEPKFLENSQGMESSLEQADISHLPEVSDNSEETKITKEVSFVAVYVCGAVKNPGVYELPENVRISDAILAAGGLLDEAAPEQLNLAAKIRDEQKIYIPTKEEAAQGFLEETDFDKKDLSEKKRINLNLANAEQLTALPGIGLKRAEAIISYREAAGGFKSPEELLQIDGIGEALLEKIRDLITVGEKDIERAW